jgi:hypothetical protein
VFEGGGNNERKLVSTAGIRSAWRRVTAIVLRASGDSLRLPKFTINNVS